jgi:hypothetical protein
VIINHLYPINESNFSLLILPFMRKIILGISFIIMLFVILGADIRRNESSNATVVNIMKKKCLGYTIIEFGKGIDCNGDTVKLVKVNGVQVLAAN